MNLEGELKLPVLTHGGKKLTLGEVIGGPALMPYCSFSGGLQPVGAKERLEAAEKALLQYDHSETARLAIARTESQPGDVYHVLNGKSYTAVEVVREIQTDSKSGRHFATLQKRAALIATRQSMAKLGPPNS